MKAQVTDDILAVGAFWADISLSDSESRLYYDFYDSDTDSDNSVSTQIQNYIRTHQSNTKLVFDADREKTKITNPSD
jgi:hypothetical protein